ncbi:MAG: hypothetical protein IAG13_28750 [Deltaproteobacteria bacterium]|nr:hypothetical protein [Nannocystaceae bacterium]
MCPGNVAAAPAKPEDFGWYGARNLDADSMPFATLPRGRAPTTRSWVMLSAAIAMGGCGSELRVSDDVDLAFDFERTGDRGTLHSPYVEGASLRVRVRDDAGRDALDLDGYSLASSDPEVLLIGPSEQSGDAVVAEAEAAAEGIAELWLVDRRGEVISGTEIEVRAPTRVMLHAAAPLFLDRDDVPSAVDEPQVLVDGVATFMVEYFDGSTRLFGNGTLGVSADGPLVAEVAQEHMHERRDWLRVTPTAAGLHELELRAHGQRFARVQLESITTDAIAELALRGQDQARARRDQQLVVIVEAYDEDGDRIFGAAADWELAGGPDGEPGEMYRYAYQPAQSKSLAATLGDLRGEATIDAR